MANVIVSTVGTSLLTNQADSAKKTLLNKYANHQEEDFPPEVRNVVRDCEKRARDLLRKDARTASAELNGIYGIYGGHIPENARQDRHLLVGTDTYQGKITANIVREYLDEHGISDIQTIHPTKLSTANTECFLEGIKDLLNTLEKQKLESFRDKGYRIVFNLVGGFKSLQGYMNTIAMFYADEIVYIFEGEGSHLISIPRLPIEIQADLSQQAQSLALLATDEICLPQNEVSGIPELILDDYGDDGVTLSAWGTLIWNKTKGKFLAGNLLKYPRLRYEKSFEQDTKNVQGKDRVQLQETLAKVSALLLKNDGNLASLRSDGGLRYETYKNRNDDVGHFRVSQGIRISCQPDGDGNLLLRRYGKEPEVNRNP